MGAAGSFRYLAYLKEDKLGELPVTEPSGSSNHLADDQTVPQAASEDGNGGELEAEVNREYVARVDTEITIAEGETLTVSLEGADEESGSYSEVKELYSESSSDGDLVIEAGEILGRYRWNKDDPKWLKLVMSTTDSSASGSLSVFRNTPELKRIRNTGGNGINTTRNEMQSEELRDDRQIADHRLGNRRAELDIPFELSYESFDDFLEAALWGSWDNDEMKAGTTEHSFTIEEGFTDVDVYKEINGALVNEMSLEIQPDSMITGSFSMLALRARDPHDHSLTPESVVDVSTRAPFDSFNGELKIDDEVVADIAGISLQLQNGVDPKFAVLGGQNAYRMLVGRSRLSGTINADFKDSSHYERFLKETEIHLEFEIEDLDGNKYIFEMPRTKYNSGQQASVSENDVTLDIPVMMLRDDELKSQLKITRKAAS